MRLDNLKNEFPKMPEDMRKMVETEVEKQVNTSKSRFMVRKVAVAALVAIMVIGTTVFAGTQIYKLYGKKVGKYGVITKVENNETSTNSQKQDAPNINLVVGYMPEDMFESTEGAKWSKKDSPHLGGVSLAFYRMDKDDKFEVLNTNVLEKKEMTIGGYEAIYLKMNNIWDKKKLFDRQIYVYYPEYRYVMLMYVGTDITDEEAIKIIEGISLEKTDSGKGNVPIAEWGEDILDNERVEGNSTTIDSITKDKMKNTHKIGEEFNITDYDAPISAKVVSVKIMDDINALDSSNTDIEAFKERANKNGEILPNTIKYIKRGDGVNTIDKVVKETSANQKVVYVTVEYKNAGNKTLKDVLYWGSITNIVKNKDSYSIFSMEPSKADKWDYAEMEEGDFSGTEMQYCDVKGNDKNYIKELKAGETVTVNMAFLVNEELLQYSYLNLNPIGETYSFGEEALNTGYVDIRQK